MFANEQFCDCSVNSCHCNRITRWGTRHFSRSRHCDIMPAGNIHDTPLFASGCTCHVCGGSHGGHGSRSGGIYYLCHRPWPMARRRNHSARSRPYVKGIKPFHEVRKGFPKILSTSNKFVLHPLLSFANYFYTTTCYK